MTGPVLVLNAGSSSVKYQLLDPHDATVLASGLVEQIGAPTSRSEHHTGEVTHRADGPARPDHAAALRAVLEAFEQHGPQLSDVGLHAVGHRVVHGGDRFDGPVVVDADVEAAIEALVPLAPLHNGPNLEGVRVARALFPDVPQVAVFDTAFHHSIPEKAHTYAVPASWRTEHGVRRYGFHGTSHAYVSREAARLLGRTPEQTNVIVLHLGNGASAAAVQGGRSIDTSMGLTPLQGLVMGSRSGDVDPAVVAHLRRVAGLSADEIDDALNRRSGLVALAGTNDLREIGAAAADGDPDALLALEVYCYRIRSYVGAYYAALGRVDAVVFTAGVGENDAGVRAASVVGLERLGIAVDPERNAAASKEARVVSPPGAEVAVLVVPTQEELEIARQAVALLDR